VASLIISGVGTRYTRALAAGIAVRHLLLSQGGKFEMQYIWPGIPKR